MVALWRLALVSAACGARVEQHEGATDGGEEVAAPWVSVAGVAGKNECPAKQRSISTEAECEAAAAELGKTFKSWTAKDVWKAKNPKGCYFGAYGNSKTVNWNDHPAGVGRKGRTPICKKEVLWSSDFPGFNECPVGYKPVTSEGDCIVAATALGKKFKTWTAADEWKAKNPKGCYLGAYGDANVVNFNDHPTGVGRKGRALICEAA